MTLTHKVNLMVKCKKMGFFIGIKSSHSTVRITIHISKVFLVHAHIFHKNYKIIDLVYKAVMKFEKKDISCKF